MIIRENRIKKLNLGKNPLIGSQVPENFTFSPTLIESLVELNMSECEVNQNLFKAICKCKNIQILNLNGNVTIKKFLQNTETLENLLNSLIDLSLKSTYLGIKILKLLSNCKKLKRLNGSRSNLKSLTHRFDFGSLKETLVDLNMSNCNLGVYALLAISTFNKLEILNVNNNENLGYNIRSNDLKSTLIELSISGCHLRYEDLVEICKCANLVFLDVSNNDLSSIGNDQNPFTFNELKKSLLKLSMRNCDLPGFIFMKIIDCENIEYLDVSDNYKFVGDLYENFNFEKLENTLKILKMKCCKVDEDLFKGILKCTKIQYLDIEESFEVVKIDLKSIDFDNLRKSIIEIHFEGCNLKSEWFSVLNTFEKLEVLDISNNFKYDENINDEFDFKILKYTLVKLIVSKCGLNFHFLKSICNCYYIQKLDLSFNSSIYNDIYKDFSFLNLKDQITEFKTKGTNITKESLKSINQWYGIDHLNISEHNNIVDVFNSISNLENLYKSVRYLNIRACKCDSKIFDVLPKFSCIQKVDISDNNLLYNEIFKDIRILEKLNKSINEIIILGMLKDSSNLKYKVQNMFKEKRKVVVN